MECLAQCLDNLEDLIFAAVLKAERIRQAAYFVLFIIVSALLQVLGIIVALSHPPLALAIVALLLVWVLFRSAVDCSNESLVTT